jgi:hypothetical protein
MEGLVYVINLDRSKQRWKAMELQFALQDLPVIRYSAFDGRTLETSEEIALVHPEALASARRGKRKTHDDHNYGSIGCFLSHMAVWKKIVASSRPYGVVFEDDIRLPKNFITQFLTMLSACPPWDMIVFGPWAPTSPIRQRVTNQRMEFVTCRWILLNSYVIRSDLCRKLLQKSIPIRRQVDWWISSETESDHAWLLRKPLTSISPLAAQSDINHTPLLQQMLRFMRLRAEKGLSGGITAAIVVIILAAIIVAVVAVSGAVYLCRRKAANGKT